MNKIVLLLSSILILVLVGCIDMNKDTDIDESKLEVYIDDYLYGYKDENDKIIIKAKYDGAFPFSDGVALVIEDRRQVGKMRNGGESWKYIDKNGKVVLNLDVYRADSFSDEYAAVLLEENSEGWAYIDKSGAVVLEPQYDCASMFKNGVASVHIGGNKGKWILINKKGECIKDLEEPLDWESHVQGDYDRNSTLEFEY